MLFPGSGFELGSSPRAVIRRAVCSEPGLLPALGKAEEKPAALVGFGAKQTRVLLGETSMASLLLVLRVRSPLDVFMSSCEKGAVDEIASHTCIL